MTEQRTADQRCGNCRWFDKKDLTPAGDQSGNTYVWVGCRRYPPGAKGWPFVQEDDYCGEWKTKETQQ